MRERQDDGSTTREHMEALVRQGRKPSEELHGPGVPDEVRYLWRWFGELDRARARDEYGPVALAYSEIDAWARLTDRRPAPHEVEALMEMDGAMRYPAEDDTEE